MGREWESPPLEVAVVRKDETMAATQTAAPLSNFEAKVLNFAAQAERADAATAQAAEADYLRARGATPLTDAAEVLHAYVNVTNEHENDAAHSYSQLASAWAQRKDGSDQQNESGQKADLPPLDGKGRRLPASAYRA
jgi:hypothetical protein